MLPKSELRPDLTLELGDTPGLAGLAGDPGAQCLTRAPCPSPPKRTAFGRPFFPGAECPGSQYQEA